MDRIVKPSNFMRRMNDPLKKFTFGLLGAYGIVHNVLVKNNVMVGYKFDENRSVYLRA